MSEKNITARSIAVMVGGVVSGDPETEVQGFAPLETAGGNEITFFVNVKKIEQLKNAQAGIILVPNSIEELPGCTLIKVKNPYLASAIVHTHFLEEPFKAEGVHPRAFVDTGVIMNKEVTIGPLAIIGKNAVIGERVIIEAGAVLGADVVVGADSRICSNVTIYNGSILGERVIIHSGTVIGSDGYGYAPNEKGEHVKRPQVGIVRIDNDVEIGANSCVDRAAYGETWIQSGVKIDNLVQVGHNVVVGPNSLLVAQAGIAGSTTLGRNNVMGGQVAIAGHLNIGDRVMVAARGGLHSDTPDDAILGGAPAIPARQWAKCCAIYNKLPELQAKVRKNSKAIAALNTPIDEDE